MRAGDIVLAALPQADESTKIRSALLLCALPPFGDWLACGITSQIRHAVPDFDEVIARDDVDYAGTRLHDRSLIRLGFLDTLARTQIGDVLKQIATDRLQRLRHNLVQHLLTRSRT